METAGQWERSLHSFSNLLKCPVIRLLFSVEMLFLGGGASSFSVALSVTTNSPGQQHHFLFLWKVLS